MHSAGTSTSSTIALHEAVDDPDDILRLALYVRTKGPNLFLMFSVAWYKHRMIMTLIHFVLAASQVARSPSTSKTKTSCARLGTIVRANSKMNSNVLASSCVMHAAIRISIVFPEKKKRKKIISHNNMAFIVCRRESIQSIFSITGCKSTQEEHSVKAAILINDVEGDISYHLP